MMRRRECEGADRFRIPDSVPYTQYKGMLGTATMYGTGLVNGYDGWRRFKVKAVTYKVLYGLILRGHEHGCKTDWRMIIYTVNEETLGFNMY